MMLQLLFADDDSPACSQAMFHLLFADDVSPAVRRVYPRLSRGIRHQFI